jgi:hypothetical protein
MRRAGKNDQALFIADDIKDNQQKINYHGRGADAIVKSMMPAFKTAFITNRTNRY